MRRHHFHPSNKLQKRRMIPGILKKRNQFICIDLIVIMTKTSFTVKWVFIIIKMFMDNTIKWKILSDVIIRKIPFDEK